jgi:hypothetical protein
MIYEITSLADQKKRTMRLFPRISPCTISISHLIIDIGIHESSSEPNPGLESEASRATLWDTMDGASKGKLGPVTSQPRDPETLILSKIPI